MDISKIKVSGTLYDIKDATARGSLSSIDSIVQNLAAVATSGSYADLSDKPTIGSGVLTIQKNGTTVDTFNANATQDKSINITVPTAVSLLTNDSGYLTSQDLVTVMDYKGTKATVSALPSSGNKNGDVWHVTENNAEYAWNGSTWEELGTPIDLSGYALLSSLATVATTGSYSDLTGTPDLSGYATSASLATVATTGDYDDLTNKPTIPSIRSSINFYANLLYLVTYNPTTLNSVDYSIDMRYGGTTGNDAETLILNLDIR